MWMNDKKHGKGKYQYRDTSSYDGEWMNDRKEGKGVFTWANGMKYSGSWLADKVIFVDLVYFINVLLIYK